MLDMLLGSLETEVTETSLWFQAGIYADGDLATLRFVQGTNKDMKPDETIEDTLKRLYGAGGGKKV